MNKTELTQALHTQGITKSLVERPLLKALQPSPRSTASLEFQQETIDAIKGALIGDPFQGLTLTGSTGTGKTYLLSQISQWREEWLSKYRSGLVITRQMTLRNYLNECNAQLVGRGREEFFYSPDDIYSLRRRNDREHESFPNSVRWLNLVIDEIDTPVTTPAAMTTFSELLNACYENDWVTFNCTMNVSFADFAKTHAAHDVRRIEAMTKRREYPSLALAGDVR